MTNSTTKSTTSTTKSAFDFGLGLTTNWKDELFHFNFFDLIYYGYLIGRAGLDNIIISSPSWYFPFRIRFVENHPIDTVIN